MFLRTRHRTAFPFLLAAFADHSADVLGEFRRVDRRSLEVLASQRAEVPPRVDFELRLVGMVPPVDIREADDELLLVSLGEFVDECERVEAGSARRELCGEVVCLDELPRLGMDHARLGVADVVEVEKDEALFVGLDVGNTVREPEAGELRGPLSGGLEVGPHLGIVVADVAVMVVGIGPRRAGSCAVGRGR